jgi:hypothetical protein
MLLTRNGGRAFEWGHGAAKITEKPCRSR